MYVNCVHGHTFICLKLLFFKTEVDLFFAVRFRITLLETCINVTEKTKRATTTKNTQRNEKQKSERKKEDTKYPCDLYRQRQGFDQAFKH